MTLVSLFLLTPRLLLTAAAAAAAGFLVIEPPSLVVEHGAPASANCSTSISHNGIGWEASQDPIPMKSGVQFLTWRVKSVTHYDIKPICYINGDDQTEKNLPVTVYKIPDRVSISLKDHTGHLIEGRSYTLQCDVQGVAPVRSLVVSWYQNNVVLNRNRNFSEATPFPVNKSAKLQIEAWRIHDGATFWCEAELELGPEGPVVLPSKKSVPLSVSVHYKPEFSNQMGIIFQSHEEIILNCTVISNPPSVYTWSSRRLEQEHQGSVLVLKSKSSGNYTCRASNPYGQDEKVYIIQARPEVAAGGALVFEPPNLLVELGAPASAKCSTNISHLGMGWESSQGPIPIKTGVQFLTWRVEKITNFDLKPICYIDTESVRQVKELPVTVYKIPDRVSISLKDHTGHLIEGKSYTLQCDVQGVTPVRSLVVSWYRNNVVLNRLDFSGATAFPVNVSAELQIKAGRSVDRAAYRCEAELELEPEGPAVSPSKKSVPLSVSVHYKPEFSNQTEIIFQSHEEIILNCTTMSNPPPVYTWSSTRLEPKHQGSVLILKPKSSGNYTCRASNPYGQDEKVYIIQAQPEGPRFPRWALGLIIAAIVVIVVGLCFVVYKHFINPSQGVPANGAAGQSSPVEAVQLKAECRPDEQL